MRGCVCVGTTKGLGGKSSRGRSSSPHLLIPASPDYLGNLWITAGSRGGAEARSFCARASTSAISRGQCVTSSTPFAVEKYSSSIRAPKPAYFARAAAVFARKAALFAALADDLVDVAADVRAHLDHEHRARLQRREHRVVHVETDAVSHGVHVVDEVLKAAAVRPSRAALTRAADRTPHPAIR